LRPDKARAQALAPSPRRTTRAVEEGFGSMTPFDAHPTAFAFASDAALRMAGVRPRCTARGGLGRRA